MLLLVFTGITIELFAMAAIEIFKYNKNFKPPYPTYIHLKSSYMLKTNNFAPHNVDNNKIWGVWHVPNSMLVHEGECFNAIYHYNSYGARDIERDTIPKQGDRKRAVFIGDSFVEGYGLNDSDRMTEQFEEISNIESLNFGTSGNFGSTQMRLVYQYLASGFKHDIVFVALFPFNDFDDDIYGRRHSDLKRYRPYLIKANNDSFKLIYSLDSIKYSSWSIDSVNKQIALWKASRNQFDTIFSNMGIKYFFRHEKLRHFYKLSYTYRLFNEMLLRINTKPESQLANPDPLGLEIYKYNLNLLANIAKEKNAKVFVFTIPSKADFQYFAAKHDATDVMGDELKTYCANKNMVYLDLFSYLKQKQQYKYPAIYFDCDDHFNALGSKLTAEFLWNRIK